MEVPAIMLMGIFGLVKGADDADMGPAARRAAAKGERNS